MWTPPATSYMPHSCLQYLPIVAYPTIDKRGGGGAPKQEGQTKFMFAAPRDVDTLEIISWRREKANRGVHLPHAILNTPFMNVIILLYIVYRVYGGGIHWLYLISRYEPQGKGN